MPVPLTLAPSDRPAFANAEFNPETTSACGVGGFHLVRDLVDPDATAIVEPAPVGQVPFRPVGSRLRRGLRHVDVVVAALGGVGGRDEGHRRVRRRSALREHLRHAGRVGVVRGEERRLVEREDAVLVSVIPRGRAAGMLPPTASSIAVARSLPSSCVAKSPVSGCAVFVVGS